MAEQKSADIERAFDYPYTWPDASFTVQGTRVTPFRLTDRTARKPVLAIGSNRSPRQLIQKFNGSGVIPVEKVELKDFDVVYAARLSRYGAVPATLQPSMGTRVSVAITWLTDEQHTVMDRSEGLGRAYGSVALPWSCLNVAYPGACPTAYVASAGSLEMSGRFFSLAAVDASRRVWPALTSREILKRVSSFLDVTLETSEFVAQVQLDNHYRRNCLERLRTRGIPWSSDERAPNSLWSFSERE